VFSSQSAKQRGGCLAWVFRFGASKSCRRLRHVGPPQALACDAPDRSDAGGIDLPAWLLVAVD